MPLKLKLAAHERLVVNGAVLVNGDSRASLIIRNFAHIMREKDVLQEVDATTPTKRLYFLIQAMLMQPPPSAQLIESYKRIYTDLNAVFSGGDSAPIMADVDRLVAAGDFYKALARLHPLIAYEANLLNIEPHRWRRVSGPPADSPPGPLPEPVG